MPEYGMVNVVERKVEDHFDPTPNVYKFRAGSPDGESVSIVNDVINLGEITVDDFLP